MSEASIIATADHIGDTRWDTQVKSDLPYGQAAIVLIIAVVNEVRSVAALNHDTDTATLCSKLLNVIKETENAELQTH